MQQKKFQEYEGIHLNNGTFISLTDLEAHELRPAQEIIIPAHVLDIHEFIEEED